MTKHFYKGFILKRNGYAKTPWNIYDSNGEWVGYGTTLSGCKTDIDNGCFDK